MYAPAGTLSNAISLLCQITHILNSSTCMCNYWLSSWNLSSGNLISYIFCGFLLGIDLLSPFVLGTTMAWQV